MQGFSVKLPLTINNNDGIYATNKTAIEAIKQNFKMLLLTNPGERIMLPSFGIGLKRYLFENAENINKESIKYDISSQLKKYIPIIQLREVIITDLENNELEVSTNGLKIQILYFIPLLSFNDLLTIKFPSN